MHSQISPRRRLFVLLAGFFGFFTSAAIAGVPGAAITDAISANTTAAADSATVRPPAAIGRDRRTTSQPPARAETAPPPRTVAESAPQYSVLAPLAEPRPVTVSVAVVPAHPTEPPPQRARTTVQVRGPPSTTGSHTTSR